MSSVRKTARIKKGCVACGCCKKACILKAISIHKGIMAVVNDELCTGCGRCEKACPAGIIELNVREVGINEEVLV